MLRLKAQIKKHTGDLMKIIVCYDASAVAAKAVEKSIAMAKDLNAELHIFNSVPPIKNSRDVFEFIKNKEQEEIDRRKRYMAKAEKVAHEAGISCQIIISNRGKETGEDIVEYANEIGADYLVMGVRRRSKLEKIILGSNVQYVLMKSPCPVVTVKDEGGKLSGFSSSQETADSCY
jgi:nucleotide-binding universal stress UspA family protein